jgi:ribosome-binding factor A
VSKGNRSRPAPPRGKGPRTARLGELLREVLAEELERIDDSRLELVSLTSVEVDADLNRAIVSYDSLAGEAGDPEILEAFGKWRVRLQSAVGRQIHARKTPVLQFRPDEVIRQAERIEQLLKDEQRRSSATGSSPDGGAGPSDGDAGPSDGDAGPA